MKPKFMLDALKAILPAVLLVASTAAWGGGAELARVSLDTAESRWNDAALSTYEYTLRSSHPFGHTVYRINVTPTGCKASARETFMTRTAPWKLISCEGLTIPELIAELRRRLQDRNFSVSASFDDELGFPITFTTESSKATDSERTVSISRFNAPPRRPSTQRGGRER